MKQKLQILQISRGFAAILVILFHIRDTSSTYFKVSAFGDFFRFGNIGVDYFFVLSGFIITYVHYDDLISGANRTLFLKKRLIRIYPTYWAAATITLFVLIFILHGKSPHLDHEMKLSSFSEWVYILSCYLLLPIKQSYFLQLAWTLGYEIIFYLVFFVGIIIKFKRAKVVLVIWVLLIISHVLFNFHCGTLMAKITSSYNLEFLTGCLIAYLFRNNLRIPKQITVSMLIIIPVICLIKFYLFEFDHAKNFLDFILFVMFLGLLLYLIVEIDIDKKINCPFFLLLVGEATYSIYLSHPFFLGSMGRLFSKFLMLLHIENFYVIQCTLIIISILTIIGGIGFFKYIEKPAISFCNKLFLKKKAN